jgi:hypothetical protein
LVNQALETNTIDLADGIVGVFKAIWQLRGDIHIPPKYENEIQELIIKVHNQGYNRGIEDAKKLFMTFIG